MNNCGKALVTSEIIIKKLLIKYLFAHSLCSSLNKWDLIAKKLNNLQPERASILMLIETAYHDDWSQDDIFFPLLIDSSFYVYWKIHFVFIMRFRLQQHLSDRQIEKHQITLLQCSAYMYIIKIKISKNRISNQLLNDANKHVTDWLCWVNYVQV
jgi:hypothetical protein